MAAYTKYPHLEEGLYGVDRSECRLGHTAGVGGQPGAQFAHGAVNAVLSPRRAVFRFALHTLQHLGQHEAAATRRSQHKDAPGSTAGKRGQWVIQQVTLREGQKSSHMRIEAPILSALRITY